MTVMSYTHMDALILTTHTLIVVFWDRSLHLPSIGCSREWESEWTWEGPCDEEKGGWEKGNSSAL